ncbi:MAG: hypothetical protein K2Y32_06555 [Candidatus Obscuribacterales bacterium]|nr:hypothetical protein [Candidatus Obscuribacterales bacterium]
MKDDVPDLTPYLSKKGGNSQAKSEPGKADISEKLSALVKKPTGSATNVPAVGSVPAQSSSQSSSQSPSTGASSSPASAASSDSWAKVVSEAKPSVIDYSASNSEDALEAIDETNFESSVDSRLEAVAEISKPPSNADGGNNGRSDNHGLVDAKPRAMGTPATPRPLALDKFKSPQAKPMNTLSSGSAPPILKSPSAPKPSGRVSQPYNLRDEEPIMEGLAPKAVSIPTNSQAKSQGNAPTVVPSRPTLQNNSPVRLPSDLNRDKPAVQLPGAPKKVEEAAKPEEKPEEKPEPKVEIAASIDLFEAAPASGGEVDFAQAFRAEAALANTNGSFESTLAEAFPESSLEAPSDVVTEVQSDFTASAPPESAPQPSPRISNTRISGPQRKLSSLFDDQETSSEDVSADALALAFQQEQEALQENPEKYGLESASARPLGFGSLLGGNLSEDEPKESALTHLMTPTGQQSTKFAPDRDGDSFDEPTSYASDNEPAPEPEPMRLSQDNQAPAFSALFSNEIVTSGADYSKFGRESQDSGVSDFEQSASSAAFTEDSIVEEPALDQFRQPDTWEAKSEELKSEEPKSEEPKTEEFKPKSPVISKLLAGLNLAESAAREASSEAVSEVSAASPEVAASNTSTTGSEADEVARLLAGVETPRHDDEEVSLEELKALLKKEKQAKKEAAKKAQEESAKKDQEVPPSLNSVEAPLAKPTPEALTESVPESLPESAPVPEPEKSVAKPIQTKPNFDYDNFDDRPISEKLADKKKAESISKSPVSSGDDEDDGPSLGDAVADALDKLLDSPIAPTVAGAVAGAVAGEKEKSLEERVLEEKVLAANLEKAGPVGEESQEGQDPMTLTQSKVDALSRLLEAASKAPEKEGAAPANRPTDSASKLAEMINKPPGKISRQMEAMEEGGTSPAFTSPFASPGSSMTNYPGQNAQSSSPASGVPQAAMSGDAVSARIAALNRKLEEQSKPPGATYSGMRGQDVIGVGQPPSASASSSSLNRVGTGSVAGMTPPPMSDEPESKSELVNRILNQARMNPTDTGVRSAMPDPVPLEQVQQLQQRNMKGQPQKSKREPLANKSRGRTGPAIHPAVMVLALLVVLGAAGGGVFYAIQQGLIKIDTAKIPDVLPSEKASIDQHIKNGEFDKAREMLENKAKGSKLSASEQEKLYGVYLSIAESKAGEGAEKAEMQEALKLLEKIPSKFKKYKEVQKLMRKLKKKVKRG